MKPWRFAVLLVLIAVPQAIPYAIAAAVIGLTVLAIIRSADRNLP